MNMIKKFALGLFAIATFAFVSCETEKLGEGVENSDVAATPIMAYTDSERNVTNDVSAVLKTNGTMEITAKFKRKSEDYRISTLKMVLRGTFGEGYSYPWEGGNESFEAVNVSTATFHSTHTGITYSTFNLLLPSSIEGRVVIDKVDLTNKRISGTFLYTLQSSENAQYILSNGTFFYVPFVYEE